MAAQLINNLSTTNGTNQPPRQVEQDDLQRLMTEVSGLENNANKTGDVAVKLEHNHNLIYVFARAVLERLSKDDPFMNVQQLVSQASDALDVFMASIKEVPGVLGYVLPSEVSLQSRCQEPLWLWLFPRVLTLLGRWQCETLTEKIKDFFYVSFQAVARSPKLWNLSSLFFNYLRDCVSSKWRRSCLAFQELTIFRYIDSS
jgi:serine/threonine-protein kinase ATR